MELYNYISEFYDYFHGIRLYNNIMIVDLKLPQKWRVQELLEGGISTKVNTTNETHQLISFYADFNKEETEKLMNQIRRVIKWNKDIEEKDELLNSKMIELSKLFEENKLSSLKNLDFNFFKPDIDEAPKRDKVVPRPDTQGF